MKQIIIAVFFCISIQSFSQVRHVKGMKAIEANVGLNRWSKFINVGVSKNLSDQVYAKIQLGDEIGNYKDLLKYNRIFTDWGVYYAPFNLGNSFFFNLNGGVTAYYTTISEFETPKNSYFNYGVFGGVELEYFLSDKLVLLGSFKQKILMRQAYGSQGYNVGLGIKYVL